MYTQKYWTLHNTDKTHHINIDADTYTTINYHYQWSQYEHNVTYKRVDCATFFTGSKGNVKEATQTRRINCNSELQNFERGSVKPAGKYKH